MEDTHVFEDHFVYSFRVDYKTANLELMTSEQMKEAMETFVSKYDIPHYVCFEETADITQKTHYQGAIWLSHKATAKKLTAMRNWWGRQKGGISLTKAKKLKSLLAYVKKDFTGDMNMLVTNIGIDIINIKFGTWEIDQKKVWLEKLEIKCQQLVGETNGKYQYCEAIIDFYTANSKAPPTRNTLYKYMLRYHPEFNASDYLVDLGMFKTPYQPF